jgi:hypothetical protein
MRKALQVERLLLSWFSSLRANGSRECAPDDRPREAIRGTVCGKMDCFVASLVAMTIWSGECDKLPGGQITQKHVQPSAQKYFA